MRQCPYNARIFSEDATAIMRGEYCRYLTAGIYRDFMFAPGISSTREREQVFEQRDA